MTTMTMVMQDDADDDGDDDDDDDFSELRARVIRGKLQKRLLYPSSITQSHDNGLLSVGP